MFLRTILVMDDGSVCKKLIYQRAQDCLEDTYRSNLNENDSPVFDLLNVSRRTDLFDICIRMITTGCYDSKLEWKNLVCKHIWQLEDEEYIIMYKQPRQRILPFEIMDGPFYLLWRITLCRNGLKNVKKWQLLIWRVTQVC